MRLGSILDRYTFREFFPPFLVSLFFFTFVFMITQLLEITNLLVNYQVKILVIGKLLLYSMPFFLGYVIPISVMMGVLLAFLRMSSDNEVMAIKAGGGSFYRLLPSVFAFCLIGTTLTGIMVFWALPSGRSAFEKTLINVVSSNFEVLIKPRMFNNEIDGTMIYVSQMDLKNKILGDVFIEDTRAAGLSSTVIAPHGKILSEEGSLIARLRLFDGTIYSINAEERSVHTVFFDTYDVIFDLSVVRSAAQSKSMPREGMSVKQLKKYIAETQKKTTELSKIGDAGGADYFQGTIQNAKMEIYRRFAVPISCIVLGFLAFPLGMYSIRSRRSFGLVIGLGCFVLYYLLITAGWSFGESGVYPPLLAMWMPNIVLGIIAVYLFYRLVQERAINIDLGYKLICWWKILKGKKS